MEVNWVAPVPPPPPFPPPPVVPPEPPPPPPFPPPVPPVAPVPVAEPEPLPATSNPVVVLSGKTAVAPDADQHDENGECAGFGKLRLQPQLEVGHQNSTSGVGGM